ncbi:MULTISPECIES: hypothetical protein [Corallococcus]|uniref:hypothetical protein n=1 Tax=Corallococcus TaxID=83461 RepID=UPI00117C42EB|nr:MULTISPECIES: hypothetical protein [Corallococcus]NBD07929.1 hypothetical protein [Corallococcus silvisoli]TSC33912.1 hypothetical protein FOF48_02360 [Corallococcus sp. Z5C101001]
MGNASGRQKQKPLILDSVAGSAPGLFKATFTTHPDREGATLTESSKPNAYHLPWKNGDYTEGEVDLTNEEVEYFFTSDLSGCSLWYKFTGGRIKIRHEARTDKGSQDVHRLAGFKCVVDSSLNKDDVQLAVDADTMIRSAQFYVVYALFEHESKSVDFRVQLVQQKKNLLTRVEVYELVKVGSVVVEFPEG